MRIARHCVFCGHPEPLATPAVLMPFVAHRALGYAPVDITPDWNLRNIPTGPLHCRCNTLYCPRCQGVFLDQRFDATEMANLYAGYRSAEYTRLRAQYEPGYDARNAELVAASHAQFAERLLDDLGLLPENPAILDWGGDDGCNTPFRTRSRRCDVLDISGKQPLPGVNPVTPADVAKINYDLVVLSHILEHIPEPGEFLREVDRVIQPGTLIYVEVPFEPLMLELSCAATPAACAARKRHWHEHINFFSPEALHAVLSDTGWSCLATPPSPVPQLQYRIALKPHRNDTP
jgi:Zn-finger nucleic acid-binding protein